MTRQERRFRESQRLSPPNVLLRDQVLNGRCKCGNHATVTLNRDSCIEDVDGTIKICSDCLAGGSEPQTARRGRVYIAPPIRRQHLRDSNGKGSPGWKDAGFNRYAKRTRTPRSKVVSVTLSKAALARRTNDNPLGLTALQLRAAKKLTPRKPRLAVSP